MGNEDTVTFTEMFEEVKLYAAAFRKNGLKKGDTVACKFAWYFSKFYFIVCVLEIFNWEVSQNEHENI